MAENTHSHRHMVCLHNIPFSTLFTTRNKELTIFGNTLNEMREKLISFFDAYERGGIKGESGIIDTFFSKKAVTPITPKIKSDFEQFKNMFNTTPLSVDAVAEKFDNIDQRILDYAKTCKNGEMTTKGFEESLNSMSRTSKIGQAALQAFATAGNMVVGFLASKVIQAAVTAIDNWIHRVDKANEAMENAVSKYDSAKSNLEDINSQLETHQETLNSLLAKDKLTYAEKGQLKELQAITRELQLQRDIEQSKADAASKEAADKAMNAFEKQYSHDLSEESLNRMLSADAAPMTLDENDIVGNIAAYTRAKELYEESMQKYQNPTLSDDDAAWYADEAQYYEETMTDYANALDNNLADLWDKLNALKSEYNKAFTKQQNAPSSLSTSEKDIIASYESIYDTIQMIYRHARPDEWNDMEFFEKELEDLKTLRDRGTIIEKAYLDEFRRLYQRYYRDKKKYAKYEHEYLQGIKKGNFTQILL